MKLVFVLLATFFNPLNSQVLEIELLKKLFPDEITDDMKYVMGSNHGQLGNACFMAATGIGYALDNGLPFIIDPDAKKRYPLVLHRFPEYFVGKPKKELYHTPENLYFSNMNESTLILGWPNSDFWFSKYKDVIVDLLGPTKEMKEYLQEKYSEYFRKDKNYVGLHIRTFVQKGEDTTFYPIEFFKAWGICPEFYQEAIKLFPEDSVFVVFSDNIELAKKLLRPFRKNCIFQNDSDMYEDFYLMSMMQRMIIPNSSFSAFACFLNTNPNKLIVKPENNHCAYMIENNWIFLKSNYRDLGMRRWHRICRNEYKKLGFNKE